MVPPPRQEARFFFAISLRKSLPFTFSKSEAAWLPQSSPPLSLCAVIRSLSFLIVDSHFSLSTRRKNSPPPFFFPLEAASSFCGLAFGDSAFAAFGDFFGDFAGDFAGGFAGAGASFSRFCFFGFGDAWSSSSAARGREKESRPALSRFRFFFGWRVVYASYIATTSMSPGSSTPVSLRKDLAVFVKPLATRKARRCGYTSEATAIPMGWSA